MVQINPSDRPSIEECSVLCNEILNKMRREENERTQVLSDISTTYNNNYLNKLERTFNMKS